jgi:hypothetical protein
MRRSPLRLTLLLAVAISASAVAFAGGQPAIVVASYTLPNIPFAQAQNVALPGSITNDRNVLPGGVGSDL